MNVLAGEGQDACKSMNVLAEQGQDAAKPEDPCMAAATAHKTFTRQYQGSCKTVSLKLPKKNFGTHCKEQTIACKLFGEGM